VTDEADVRFIDAHAEGDRGSDHHAVLLQEHVLIGVSRRLLHAGVIGQRPKTGLAQRRCQCLAALTGCAIDDPAHTPVRREEIGDLPARRRLRLHR
jgi:hypothetical protein